MAESSSRPALPTDGNHRVLMGGVSSVDGVTPVPVEVDPDTGAFSISDVPFAVKTVEVGDITYVAEAPPGSSLASAVWRARKVDESSGTVVTWADGNSKFDNVASNLASLTYS